MTRRTTALGLGALLLLTACGSPNPELSLGFKEVPSNVLLGAPSSPAAAPTSEPVSAVPLPPPPSVVSLPPPPFQLPSPGAPVPPAPPLPSGPACPTPDPLAAPAVEAPTTISAPPAKAAYLFDNAGTFSVSGADARTGTFPARTVRLFDDVQTRSGAFSYTVAERIGEVTTTTTYDVVSRVSLPGQETGVFITKTTYARADGTTSTFTPVPALKLAALPLLRGASLDSRGVDAQTQTAMSFTSTVEGKARVFACGTPLDTWTIHLTAGRLVSPTQDLEFDATYQLGTQFGGIVVADVVAFQGNDGAAGIERSNRATISAVPRKP